MLSATLEISIDIARKHGLGNPTESSGKGDRKWNS